MTMFQKAVKAQAKLRLAIDGPSGSGKTYTALVAATALANGGKIAVIDTERGSASLYSDKFVFDTATLNTFSPLKYVELIEAAEAEGYTVIVIDSLSHAWEGEGGALEMVDDAAKRSQSKNSFTAWKDVTPIHRKLIDAMLQSKAHIIATMRSKTEYVIEEVERNGRKMSMPRKIGMAPVQRQGMEYEFTIVGDMDLEHNFIVSKSRMSDLADVVENKPNAVFFKKVLDWLNSGEVPTSRPAAQPSPNGQKPNPPQEPEPEPATATMSLEMAESELTSDKPPRKYGDLTSDELSTRDIGIRGMLKRTDLEPETRATYQRKHDAIVTILNHRAAQE